MYACLISTHTMLKCVNNQTMFVLAHFCSGKKLPKITKRLMTIFSFYKFKQRLLWKSSLYNKKVIIVNESFTSKTCSKCFSINNLKGNEIFKCKICKFEIDRDVNGSRNILIKNTNNLILDNLLN